MKNHVIRFRSYVTLKLELDYSTIDEGSIDVAEPFYQTVKPGDITSAHIRPYVKNGIELADLTLFNGTVVRGVRFAHFQFLDKASIQK